MPTRSNLLAFVKYVDIIPMHKTVGNSFIRFKISAFEIVHSLIRENDSEPPGHVVRVLLINIDLPFGVVFFRQ